MALHGHVGTLAGSLNSHALVGVAQYLDVESTVRLSQTCGSLRTTFTHDPGGRYPKIKVSHFSLEDRSMWRDKNGIRWRPDCDDPDVITTIATQLLSKIHFPSLKAFELPGRTKFANCGHDDMKELFISLSFGLESATKLQVLHFDVGKVFLNENFNARAIYETFGRNLAKCTQLRCLKIVNRFRGRSLNRLYSLYSPGFLLALLPAVERVESALEEFVLILGDFPSISPTSNRAYANVARDVFAATFRLKKLREIDVRFDLALSPLLNEFLEACAHVYHTSGRLPSECLEKFALTTVLYNPLRNIHNLPVKRPTPLSVAPCLALLGGSSNLQMFVVKIPSACWDSKSLSKLKDVLSLKPRLSHLGLSFQGYKCNDRRVVQHILDYLQTRELCSENRIHVSGLVCNNVSSDQGEALSRYYNEQGQKCSSWDATGLKFNVNGCLAGR